jgi:hypothetical protein
MGTLDRTSRARRAPAGMLAALLTTATFAIAGCGSSTDTATAPTTAPSAIASNPTTSTGASTEDPDTTATPGAVSGAAAIGAAGSEEGDASTVDADDGATTDDTTSAEGVIAETGADEVAPDVTWALSATEYRGQEGLLVAYECPADGTLGAAWGTDAYTDDSSVCTAAVHLGLIGEVDGGLVVIQISDGLDAYEGSTANGVTTGSYAAWAGTFTFVG